MSRNKITSKDIQTARLVIAAMDEGQTEITQEIKDDLARWNNVDVDVIQHLVKRMLTEGKLPEEQHRALAKGAYDGEWVETQGENMADDILNEFPTQDGKVIISTEEFRDIIAYVAEEYYG